MLRKLDRGWRGEETITDVSKTKEGWSISCKGSGFFLSREQLGEMAPPKIGDTVTVYTHRGSMIRGVDLRGKPLFYKTDAELEREQEQWVAKHKAEQRAKFEKDRPSLDRKFAALPEVFQRRVSWFRANNPDFRWENEAYEMCVCVDAVKIAKTMKTPRGVLRFSKMSYEKQKVTVANLDRAHSGNSFGMAVRLAYFYVGHEPLMVIAEHGALTPLVGCEEYGCAHPRPLDVEEAIDRSTSLSKEVA